MYSCSFFKHCCCVVCFNFRMFQEIMLHLQTQKRQRYEDDLIVRYSMHVLPIVLPSVSSKLYKPVCDLC